MHETTTTNGTHSPMHEANVGSEAARLRAEVVAHTERYEALRVARVASKDRVRAAEAERTSINRDQARANAAHVRAREARDEKKAAIASQIDHERGEAANIDQEMRDVLRSLRKAQQKLAIEESDRTPRAPKS